MPRRSKSIEDAAHTRKIAVYIPLELAIELKSFMTITQKNMTDIVNEALAYWMNEKRHTARSVLVPQQRDPRTGNIIRPVKVAVNE